VYVRKLVFVGVVGLFVTSAVAMAAIRVSVSPAEGSPRTKFTVSFVVDRPVSGYQWLTVEVVSPTRHSDCEYQESAAVTYAPKGRRVSVELRPVDKLRWCPGVYRGTVHRDTRIGCGEAGLDRGPCSRIGPTVARFSFSVTP
jgi:hypothetical protein